MIMMVVMKARKGRGRGSESERNLTGCLYDMQGELNNTINAKVK